MLFWVPQRPVGWLAILTMTAAVDWLTATRTVNYIFIVVYLYIYENTLYMLHTDHAGGGEKQQHETVVEVGVISEPESGSGGAGVVSYHGKLCVLYML